MPESPRKMADKSKRERRSSWLCRAGEDLAKSKHSGWVRDRAGFAVASAWRNMMIQWLSR